MAKSATIIFCQCAYSDVIPRQLKQQVLRALKERDLAFELVPDLCHLAARRASVLKNWAKADSLKIIACYPRAVRCLFDAAGAPLPKTHVEILNMRSDTAERIITSLPAAVARSTDDKPQVRLEKTDDWMPWFPVIDYDRCQNCKQCMNFCLFGVYGLSQQGKVEVQKPANCKTNCPACARICPQTAIIFPKYAGSPINGDQVSEEAAAAEKTKVNFRALLDRNIYQTIRNRGKGRKRFAKSTDQSETSTDKDKTANLEELREQLDIPREVLESLSPAQLSANNPAGLKPNSNHKCCQCDNAEEKGNKICD